MATRTRATRIGAGVSTKGGTADAVVEAARSAGESLGGDRPDLAFLFLSPPHLDDAPAAAHAIRDELGPGRLIGCVADGVLAGGREVESGPAAAVWAAALPGAEIETFHAAAEQGDDGVEISGLPSLGDPALVGLLVDPFTFPISGLLGELNGAHPGLPLVGGIAAGAGRPDTQALIVDGELHSGGAAGVVVSGVPVRTVVSQGCSPFGREAVVTEAEGNVVSELAGERPLDRLRAEVAALPAERRALVAKGILAGLVIDENKAEYGRGDYLVRGVLGADEDTGAIALGEQVRVGQTLRFHVRDAASADEDLRESLRRGLGAATPAGALLFTCNGRGTHMFPEPDHDARVVSQAVGGEAVAGFFCGGEIGPVGGRVFLHGFTATLAVFLQDDRS
jgi:small ligand-binding sensory domain FIST